MEWSELDALADELRRTIARGSLRGCPALGEIASRTLDAERVARITLADIDHVRAWERSDAFPRLRPDRRCELARAARELLHGA
jgi:hypothetical protein